MRFLREAAAGFLLLSRTGVFAILDPPGGSYTYNFQKVWDVTLDPVPKNDPRALGSCAKWKEKIIRSYEETLNMLNTAYKASGEIEEKQPSSSKEALLKEWLRKSEPWHTLFNPQKTDMTHAKEEIKSNFEAYLEAHRVTPAEQGPKHYLRCGDDFVKYLKPTHPDPRDEGTADKGKHTLAKPSEGREAFPNGALYAEHLPKDISLLAPVEVKTGLLAKFKKQRLICDSPKSKKVGRPFVHAASFPGNKGVLVLCPLLLDRPDWSVDTIQRGLKQGDSVVKFSFALATTWVHEMGHYVAQWRDHPALDADGDPIGDEDQLGLTEYTYSADEAMNLAKHKPEEARVSPENHALYSLVTYVYHWYWPKLKAAEAPASAGLFLAGKRRKHGSGSGPGFKAGDE